MPELTVDYTIPVTVRVNTDTDEVLGVFIHGDSFQSDPERRVFTCNVDDLPEYLLPEHKRNPKWAKLFPEQAALADKAFEIAERVRLVPAEGPLVYVEDRS